MIGQKFFLTKVLPSLISYRFVADTLLWEDLSRSCTWLCL
uniref:Uncharacterized protein n=1 Tax=Aegilops tauschii subsp. strangulata TaxID=200361 RepID=A0A453T7I8_AEGTS